MSGADPHGHDTIESVVRALTAIVCIGAALLVAALAFVMSRWPIG